jgi:hypothetical protein
MTPTRCLCIRLSGGGACPCRVVSKLIRTFIDAIAWPEASTAHSPAFLPCVCSPSRKNLPSGSEKRRGTGFNFTHSQRHHWVVFAIRSQEVEPSLRDARRV